MAIHSSTLAWEIPWTEEPGGLYSPWGWKESDITTHTCMHTLHTMDINPSWDIHVWKHSHSKACLLPLFMVYFIVCVCSRVHVCTQVQLLSHVWLGDSMDCSPLGSSVHRILQARMLEWVAISYSSGSSWPRDGTCISCISLTLASGFFTAYPPRKPYSLIHGFKCFNMKVSVFKRSIYFYLEGDCFTVLCWFLPYINMNQP